VAAWSAAGALAGGNWWRAARWQACRAAAGARRRLPRCAAGPELAHALARRPNLNYLPNLPACNLHARLTSHSSHALSGRVHRPRRQGHDRRPRQAGGRLAAAPTPASVCATLVAALAPASVAAALAATLAAAFAAALATTTIAAAALPATTLAATSDYRAGRGLRR